MKKPRLHAGRIAGSSSEDSTPRIRPGGRRPSSDSDASTSFANGRVVYVHGAGTQLPASELKPAWDRALFDVDAGDSTRMAYWAAESGGSDDSLPASYGGSDTSWVDQGLSRFQQALRARIEDYDDAITRGFMHQRLTSLLHDLTGYLANPTLTQRVRTSISERFVHDGPLVVVAYGAGALAVIDVLREASARPQPPDVVALITISSPHQLLVEHAEEAPERLARPQCVREWIDLFDEADAFASRTKESPKDSQRTSDDSPQLREIKHEYVDSPHRRFSPLWYIASDEARCILRDQVGPDFGQAATNFRVAKDVVGLIEDYPSKRHRVLIQLKDVHRGGSLVESRRLMHQALLSLLGNDYEKAEVEFLKRFISARLNRREVERLSERFDELKISRIWRDSAKASLIWRSVHTVQAHAAKVGYEASGQGVTWAVLDTGVQKDHPHFQTHDNVARLWDCTQVGSSRSMELASPVSMNSQSQGDVNGHGTHVAAILAGRSHEALRLRPGDREAVTLSGMAPQCSIHSYKVLNNQGRGRDSWIIKALDHIADVNDAAGELVIHGVNISLGGPFDASVYGCGHSPVCVELRRLWRQGVLVVIAVGNQGLAELQTAQGVIRANQDVTVIDPANLEEAIAVGSVHKSRPHTYGVSFFSSRGPTADGRTKPDLVAPGEKILSARSDFSSNPSDEVDDFYVAKSGTSMAAPHVSGVLAAFLSVRREFIGRPDEVKKILLQNCTCLGRDPYFQGRGMPNLVHMLANS